MENMTDETLMPWGKFKGIKMANVPSYYLKWIYDNNKGDAAVRGYIESNMDAILKDIKEEEDENN